MSRTIYAMWHGGPNYAAPYVSDDVATFPSLTAARKAFIAYRDNVDGQTPCVTESSMTIWFYDPTTTDDPYPDRMLEEGPRGGITDSPC